MIAPDLALDLGQLRADLVAEEGVCLSPYDCPAGVRTIGVGHSLEAHPIPGYDGVSEITPEQAFALLDADIARVLGELRRALPWWPALDGVRKRALAQWAFQCGTPTLVGPGRPTLALIAAGDYQRAAQRMRRWKWAREDSPPRARRVIHMLELGRGESAECPCDRCAMRRRG